MTADEIISLVFDYEHADDGDSQFCGRFNSGPSFLALQEAIHQVVGERDAALLRNVEMRILWVASEADEQAAMAELRIERDAIFAECERMRAERNL